jgi:hypothetical protein
MVYELAYVDIRLRIAMATRENGDGLGAFTAKAHTHVRESDDSPSIVKPGLTREDALRAVARAWAAKHRATGFPWMDWDAVATALRAVRAI